MKRNLLNDLKKIAGWIAVAITVVGLFQILMVKTVSAFSPDKNLKAISFSEIRDWQTLDKKSSLAAFSLSCDQMTTDNRALSKGPLYGGQASDWLDICQSAMLKSPSKSNTEITSFFQDNFTPFRVIDPNTPLGLFTGYFEPEVEGSLVKTAQYQIPIYTKPTDLLRFSSQQQKAKGFGYGRKQNGKLVHYYTRQEIELGALKNQGLELLWLKHRADAFFVQIQGSGRVKLPNGQSVRLAYGAKSGLPYTPIGKVLIERGELEKATISMQTIREWLDKNPDQAQKMMWENKSFVFFRLLKDVPSHLGPIGAQHVHLTTNTSLAVDRRYWALGTPVLLNIEVELGQSNKLEPWQSLMIAQDTGSAIRGLARGDVFWGSGADAALTAGKMKSQGTMIVLIPNTLAKKWAAKAQNGVLK